MGDSSKAKSAQIAGRLVVRLSEAANRKRVRVEPPKPVKRPRGRKAGTRATVKRSAGSAASGLDALDAVLEECKCAGARDVFRNRGRFERLTRVKLGGYLLLDFPDEVDLDDVIQRLEALEEVVSVEREAATLTDATPDDPNYTNGSQWNITQVDLESAWDISKGDGTIIGIYDYDGVDADHADLAGHRVRADCDGENNPTDDHGTQVTGVAAAVTDNTTGVAGAGYNADFIGLEVDGASDAANKIRCLVDEGADVIVTSSPSKVDDEPSSLRDAVAYAYEAGVLVICSAGNANHPTQGIPYTQWPAANWRSLPVGSTDSTDTRAGDSNYGSWLDVMAPGVKIPTTQNGGGYITVKGTSFATPLVGGIAALMRARNRTLGPRQQKEILKQTTNLPSGTNTNNNRYGNGRVNARKALEVTRDLWKAVRYGAVPKVGAATAMSDSGWWIVAYSKSVFVGYRDFFWSKMVYYNSVADARPSVAINENGDWIANYSKSTFVGYRTQAAKKMVTYPRRQTPGAVAINENGDWIAVYSVSCFTGYKMTSAVKKVSYNSVPSVAGDVAINDRGDWICCYSKSTFVGYKTSSSVKMVTYGSVADAASSVDINANGHWVCNYSKSSFVGYRTSSATKMVTYPRRNIPGSVAINDRGDWIAVYSISCFTGYRQSSSSKMITYGEVGGARSAVAINENGDWIANYNRSTFTGYRTSSSTKMVSYPRRTVGGVVDINENGDWICNYSLSTFVGSKQNSAAKILSYDDVAPTEGCVAINGQRDWICTYSRTTFTGSWTKSTVQAVRHAPEDMSKQDIEDGFAYPPSTRPTSPASVSMSSDGHWVACFGRSTTVGTRNVYTKTQRFDPPPFVV